MCKLNMEYDSMRDRIFVLLKERKITQKELAEKLNISPQTITDWKKKKSNSFMGMLGSLSSALQTTPVWLCFGIGQKTMTNQERAEKDELIFQAITSNDEKLRQDAIHSMKAGFENIKKRGFLPEVKANYPDLINHAAELLGITPRELLGDDDPEIFLKPAQVGKISDSPLFGIRIPVLDHPGRHSPGGH